MDNRWLIFIALGFFMLLFVPDEKTKILGVFAILFGIYKWKELGLFSDRGRGRHIESEDIIKEIIHVRGRGKR
jgi:hypothetical protein